MSARRASMSAFKNMIDPSLLFPYKESPSDQLRQIMSIPGSQTPFASPQTAPKKRGRPPKAPTSSVLQNVEIPNESALRAAAQLSLQQIPIKTRGRIGRPLGSKNRPKVSPEQVFATYKIEQDSQPTKKRGRPKGSKNKPKDGVDDGPAAKRLRLSPDMSHAMSTLRNLPMSMSSTFIAAPTMEDAFNNLGKMAVDMKTLFSKPAVTVVEIPPTPPETPRKSRKTTARSSPHFRQEDNVFAPQSPSKHTSQKSQHFSPRKVAGTSVIQFPILKAQSFGLIQEELASDPFHVLLATTLLTKTAGKVAIPVIRELIQKYPTPEDLATATPEDIFPDIKQLGLASKRSQAIIDLARAWVLHPPEKGKRYSRKDYPIKGAGKNILPREEPLPDEDPREAYEIAHLPNIGAYGIDSWRIFCRDDLRGVPSKMQKKALKQNEDALRIELDQEWTKVLPTDKELRAYVKWRWLRLSVDWDQETGNKKDLDMAVLKKMERRELNEHEGFSSPWRGL